jgi:hypothetical protein
MRSGSVAVSELGDQLLLAVVVFILTTVLGGAVASWYQSRRARSDLREKEREVARSVFEEVSRLMDKRLYRMLQVGWSLSPDDADDETLRTRWSDYRSVLYEWNDSLNRTLALTLRYFGSRVLEELECNVAELFAGANQELLAHYRRRLEIESDDAAVLTISELNAFLREIGRHVYTLNDQMLLAIGTRRYAPTSDPRRLCAESTSGVRRRTELVQRFKASLSTDSPFTLGRSPH